jgi:hypothetical protein
MSNCVEEKTEKLSNDDVMVIYRWFQSAACRAGRTIKMPEGTDPTKTYQYRSVRKFADRAVNEWQLDMRTIKLLIEAVVAYGKRNNLLDHGAGILNVNHVLELCVQTIESSIHRTSVILSSLSDSKTYLERNALADPAKLASARRTGGYSNLFCLFESGTLSIEYLALSKSCATALRSVDERASLPSDRELFKVRARILLDKEINTQVAAILGNDLLAAGLLEITK